MKKLLMLILSLLLLISCEHKQEESNKTETSHVQVKHEETKEKTNNKTENKIILENKNSKEKEENNEKTNKENQKNNEVEIKKLNSNTIKKLSYKEKYNLDCEKIKEENLKLVCYNEKAKEVFITDFLRKSSTKQLNFECSKLKDGYWKKVNKDYYKECINKKIEIRKKIGNNNEDNNIKKEYKKKVDNIKKKIKNKNISVCNDIYEDKNNLKTCIIKMGLENGCNIIENKQLNNECLNTQKNIEEYEHFIKIKNDYEKYNDFIIFSEGTKKE